MEPIRSTLAGSFTDSVAFSSSSAPPSAPRTSSGETAVGPAVSAGVTGPFGGRRQRPGQLESGAAGASEAVGAVWSSFSSAISLLPPGSAPSSSRHPQPVAPHCGRPPFSLPSPPILHDGAVRRSCRPPEQRDQHLVGGQGAVPSHQAELARVRRVQERGGDERNEGHVAQAGRDGRRGTPPSQPSSMICSFVRTQAISP